MPGAKAASAVARKKRLANKPDQLYAVACKVDAVPLGHVMYELGIVCMGELGSTNARMVSPDEHTGKGPPVPSRL